MKIPAKFSQPVLIFIVMTVFFACLPTAEKPADDVYFVPVDTVVRKNVKPESTGHAMVNRDSLINADKELKNNLADCLSDQNRYLHDLNSQLRVLEKKDLNDTQDNIEIKTSDGTISNETLLTAIRKQNYQLKEIIERVKLLPKSEVTDEKDRQINISGQDSKIDNKNQQQVHPDVKLPDNETGMSYADAIQLYNQRKYRSAIRAFQALLKQGIELELQDNCYFWTGVCYFNLKSPKQAINELVKVLEIPGSDKKEGAYFMIGQCHEQLGARSNARAVFTRMLQEYPNGSLYKVAEIKIALLR